jgi:ubiquinone biosynthesis monooxygenase Coq6
MFSIRATTRIAVSRGLASAASAAAGAPAAPPRPVDVVIAGGGLVGGALAAALATHPLSRTLSVVVVDPTPPPGVGGQPSLRTSTVSPSSAQFLADAGVWDRVPAARIAVFRDMLIWDRPVGTRAGTELQDDVLGAIRFDVADLPHHEQLGYVVDNDTLRAAVFAQIEYLAASGTADLSVVGTTVKSIEFPETTTGVGDETMDVACRQWPKVYLENGDVLSARLIVAADGARSRIRTMAGFDWFSLAYDQTAVVANVVLDRPTTTAYQRFLSTGPIALLPVKSDVAGDQPLANIIWTTTPTEAAALCAADDVVFLNELNLALNDVDDVGSGAASLSPGPPGTMQGKDFFDVLGDVTAPSSPVSVAPCSSSVSSSPAAARGLASVPQCKAVLGARGRFPLFLGHTPRYVDGSKRLVLVGDAAHNVHPLAGQGGNLGFADARELATALAAASATGRDIGGENGAPLMRYERNRVAANVAMIATLHSISSVFSLNSWAPFNVARRVGVSALDTFTPVKKLILRAMS